MHEIRQEAVPEVVSLITSNSGTAYFVVPRTLR